MGDWEEDWENAEISITKTSNVFANEDAVDTEALEKKQKEEAKKKAEEEAKKKKEEEEAAKKKKKGGQKIVYQDQFNIPDTSLKITKLKEEKFKKEAINDMFDGANHEFNAPLQEIELHEAEDFRVLGSLLGNKLCDPDYYLIHVEDFFKNLLDSTYEKLTSKELQEISNKVTVLIQKKQKEEKGNTKKTKLKGPTVVASKSAAAKFAANNSDSEFSNSDEEIGYKANFNEDDFI